MSQPDTAGDETDRSGGQSPSREAPSVLGWSFRSEHADRLFTVLLFVVVAAMVWMAFDFSADSRLFPFVIGFPVLGLLLLLFVIQHSKRVSDIVDRYSAQMFEFDDAVGEESDEQSESEPSEQARRHPLLGIVGWVVTLFAIIVLFGFVFGSFLFLLAYYWIAVDRSLIRTVAYSVIVWLAIMFVFSYILRTRFYEGLIPPLLL